MRKVTTTVNKRGIKEEENATQNKTKQINNVITLHNGNGERVYISSRTLPPLATEELESCPVTCP